MLGALLIVFREAMEAGLVVGIVLAATRGIEGRGAWVGLGCAAGVLGAAIVAMFAGAISNAFSGSGQELLNAIVLMIAVVSLTWHNVWMAEHGRELVTELRQVGADVSAGLRPLAALAIVVFVAVMREGSEVVLFLYGIVVAGTSMDSLLLGGILGLLAGACLTGLSYLGLIVLPTRYIFSVTTVLLTLLAAGMAAQAVRFLQAAGVLTSLPMKVWDTSWFLPDSSFLGRLLHILVGYTAKPTAIPPHTPRSSRCGRRRPRSVTGGGCRAAPSSSPSNRARCAPVPSPCPEWAGWCSGRGNPRPGLSGRCGMWCATRGSRTGPR